MSAPSPLWVTVVRTRSSRWRPAKRSGRPQQLAPPRRRRAVLTGPRLVHLPVHSHDRATRERCVCATPSCQPVTRALQPGASNPKDGRSDTAGRWIAESARRRQPDQGAPRSCNAGRSRRRAAEADRGPGYPDVPALAGHSEDRPDGPDLQLPVRDRRPQERLTTMPSIRSLARLRQLASLPETRRVIVATVRAGHLGGPAGPATWSDAPGQERDAATTVTSRSR